MSTTRPLTLATPCAVCKHPYNWHKAGVCQATNCDCIGFAAEEMRARVADMISFAEAMQSGFSEGPDQAVAALVAETYRQAADDIDRQFPDIDRNRDARYAAQFLRRRATEIEQETR